MPGNLLSENDTITCTHGGRVAFIPSQARVQLRGRPVATMADRYTVAGCPFNVNGSPHPCAGVHWENPASRVRVNGSPALLRSSTGLGQAADQVLQGPVTVSVVLGTVVGR